MPRIGRCVIAIALALLAAGCSADYSKSARDFATGIADVKAAHTALDQSVSDSTEAIMRLARLTDKSPIQPNHYCASTSTECYVSTQALEARRKPEVSGPVLGTYLVFTSRNPLVVDVPPDKTPQACLDAATASATQEGEKKAPPTEDDLLNALDRYANGLVAIARKSDQADYKAASSKLAASLGTLATGIGTAAGGVGAAAGPIVKAAVSLALDVRLQILAADRVSVLRRSVLAACIPIHHLASVEGIVLVAKQVEAQNNYRDILFSFRDLPIPVRVQHDAILEDPAARLRHLGSDPKQVTARLVEAHDTLVDAVVRHEGEDEALFARIETFLEDAAALKAAVQKASK